jgi:transcriptional regulator with XRE-family HTH domain
MLTHKQLRTKAIGTADVKTDYEKPSYEFALLDEFLNARAAQELTQARMAEKIGTTQSAVARMESGGGKHSPSLATLSKYAEALGCKLEVRLVRKVRPARNLTGRSNSRASRAVDRGNADETK